jgi:proline iminopeptidase
MSWRRRIVSLAHVNGTDLYYIEHGKGLPCLVMHGGMGIDHTYLHPWLDSIGDVLHLVYYDHRGNGRSSRPPIETLTWEELAADANALREYLGLDRTVLIGHSFGGFVALEYALRYPQYLSHLILIDTAPAWDYMEEIVANTERKGLTPEMREALTRQGTFTDEEFGNHLRTIAPLYFYKYKPEVAEKLFSKIVFCASAAERGNELQKNYNVVPRLSEIHIPTLLLVGIDDFICPPSQAHRMQKNIPNSELVIFERSGHLPYIEEPDAFFSAVRSWLARKI